MTALIKYEQLTDFQKWFLFYVIKHVTAPKNLNGVMRDMCMTVKMKINVDDFDNEQERLKGEAAQLSEHKLLALTKKYVDNDSYFLTDKGELYVIQKIIKPLFDAKSKGDLEKIRNYFKTDQQKQILFELYANMNTHDPRASLTKISEIVLKLAMPAIEIFNTLQKYSIPTAS